MKWMLLVLALSFVGCTASEGCADFVNEFIDTYTEILEEGT